VTDYHIDPQNHTGYAKPIEERVGGALERSYAHGHEIISQGIFTGTPDVHFFVHDGHGSTRALMNTSAQIIERYAYDAFGKTLPGAWRKGRVIGCEFGPP
jgi:hypothetical protein